MERVSVCVLVSVRERERELIRVCLQVYVCVFERKLNSVFVSVREHLSVCVCVFRLPPYFLILNLSPAVTTQSSLVWCVSLAVRACLLPVTKSSSPVSLPLPCFHLESLDDELSGVDFISSIYIASKLDDSVLVNPSLLLFGIPSASLWILQIRLWDSLVLPPGVYQWRSLQACQAVPALPSSCLI